MTTQVPLLLHQLLPRSQQIPILLELFRRAEEDPGLLRKRVEMTDEVRTAGSGVLQVPNLTLN